MEFLQAAILATVILRAASLPVEASSKTLLVASDLRFAGMPSSPLEARFLILAPALPSVTRFGAS